MATEAEQWVASWERTRKKGAWRFLLKCVLACGVVGFLLNALRWILDDRPFDIVFLSTMVTKALFVGLSFGALLWFWSEHRYHKSKGTKSVSDA
jgi:hypothetical protein